jgi:hypothetical protein
MEGATSVRGKKGGVKGAGGWKTTVKQDVDGAYSVDGAL